MPNRNVMTNAIETKTLFDDVLKNSQSASQFGPLRIYRVRDIPPNSFGRNGDLAIVDNTAFSDEESASGKEPTSVSFCQKVPQMVPDGPNSTVSTVNGADLTNFDQFSIDKITMMSPVVVTLPAAPVFVKQAADEINNANIMGVTAEWQNTSSQGSVANPYANPGESITINSVPVTFTGGYIDHIIARINLAGIPFIVASKRNNGIFLTHVEGGTITVGGPNIATIFGTPTLSGGLLTINNEDGFQVNLMNVTGTPLTTMGVPMTITASPLILGGVWTCFGDASIQVKNSGATVGAFNIFNFLGTGITSITDAGMGQVDINISAAAASMQNLWETINSDAGSTTATVATDTLNIIGGAGISTSVAGKTLTINNTAPGTLTLINGQPMLTFEDSTRGFKTLSAAEQALSFGENALGHQDWLRIGGNATDADSSFIADFDGTVTYATGHCENTLANSKDIHLFINGTDAGSVGTLSGGANAQFINTTLNIDFNQGDRIRLQAQDSGSGNILDTVVKITLKWRG